MTAVMRKAPFGLLGVGMGAAALAIAMIMLTVGPFSPQQPAPAGVGESAGDILKSIWRDFRGQPQPAAEPVAQGVDVDATLAIALTVLGVAAIVAGILSRIAREPRVAGRGAIWIGIGALVFKFFTWTVLMVIGALLCIELIRSVGGAEAAAEGGGGAGGGGGDGGWLEGIGEFFGGLFDWLPWFGD